MAEKQLRTAFVFGCGYLGIRVAKQLVSENWKVFALTRSSRRANELAAEGVLPIVGDWTDSRVVGLIPRVEKVLVAVGYERGSQASRERVYVDGLRTMLPSISLSSDLVYVSSTGVFHQSDGGWVDESSPCRPGRDGGRAHLDAEQLLFSHRRGKAIGRTVVLRMAGLYGPGRVPRVDSIRRGEPIAAIADSFLNLIHIDDAASCVLAAWNHPDPQSCYLVADGCPVLRGEYFSEIARICRAPVVRYSGQVGERSDTNKRIWNRRMRRDLLSRLKFPSYREGLRNILGAN